MSEEESKRNFLNCFLDLQRAAVSFYLDPYGSNHKVFLIHAKKILESLKTQKSKNFLSKISQLEREVLTVGKDKFQIMNLADKILTTGILLRT